MRSCRTPTERRRPVDGFDRESQILVAGFPYVCVMHTHFLIYPTTLLAGGVNLRGIHVRRAGEGANLFCESRDFEAACRFFPNANDGGAFVMVLPPSQGKWCYGTVQLARPAALRILTVLLLPMLECCLASSLPRS